MTTPTDTIPEPPVPIRDGWVDTRDVARLVRAALRKAFPGQRFSVKIERYSMGSAVNVRWTDGPIEKDVDAVVAVYSGKGFDGITDSTTYSNAWLSPDGTAEWVCVGRNSSWGEVTYDLTGAEVSADDAHDYRIGLRLGNGVMNTIAPRHSEGRAFTRGLRDGAAQLAKGIRWVQFAGSVSTDRDLSPEYETMLGALVLYLDRDETPGPFDPNTRYDLCVPLPGRWADWGSMLVGRLADLPAADRKAALDAERARRARTGQDDDFVADRHADLDPNPSEADDR